MILHPFFPSKFALSFNKRRFLLTYNIDELTPRTGYLNDEYWLLNDKEGNLCYEDELSERNAFKKFLLNSFDTD